MIQDFLKYIWSLWGIIHWKFNILKWIKDDNLIENIYCYSFFFRNVIMLRMKELRHQSSFVYV